MQFLHTGNVISADNLREVISLLVEPLWLAHEGGAKNPLSIESGHRERSLTRKKK